MNKEIEIDEAKFHGQLAARNAKAAVDSSQATRDELIERIQKLEFVINDHTQRIMDLERKYNLMLSERFDGKSTVKE